MTHNVDAATKSGTLTRRSLLTSAAAGVGSLLSTDASAWALLRPETTLHHGEFQNASYKGDSMDWRSSLLSRPRILKVRRPATREATTTLYWQPGTGIQRDGYSQLCWLMRDVRAGKAIAMDPRLLDLLCGIQYWLAFYGHSYYIDILSGHRTRETNSRTEGAAKHSLHIAGMAADIRIPGLPTAVLGQMAKAFGIGGTGFYVDRGFIHVDTGRVRSW